MGEIRYFRRGESNGLYVGSMRHLRLGCVLALLGVPLWLSPGGVHAEDEPPANEEPAVENSTAKMTEAERTEALTRGRGLNARAVVLCQQGQYKEATELAREALAICEKVLDPKHPVVAKCLNNLAVLLVAQGQYEEARPLYERALAIYEGALGPKHPQVAESLDNLGRLLGELGEYEKARPLHERALAIYESALGPNHPMVAQCLGNLAQSLSDRGQYKQALPLCERALAIREQALGSDHPRVASSLGSLAGLLQARGRYEQARPLYERALRIREKALGPDHPTVGVSLSNLALLLDALGYYEQARPLFERAIVVVENGLGAEHPQVASILNNLAGLLEIQGQYDQALPLYERTLALYEKAYGPEHPKVAICLNNLAMLLWAAGRYEPSRRVFARARVLFEKKLGPEHPRVASILANLAVLLRRMGEHEEARPLYERALAIREKALGPDHPVVASSLSNLAGFLKATGETGQALALYERALEIRERTFGSEHRAVASILGSLAHLHVVKGQHDRAEPLLDRCLGILERSVRRELAGFMPSERIRLVRSLRNSLDGWTRLGPHVEHAGYDAVLRVKGLVARAQAAERLLARRGGPRAARLVDALRAAERRLSKLANSMPSAFPREGSRERRKAWQEAYAEAGAEREQLALALARDFAPFRGGLERLDLTVDDIRAQFEPDAVLVDYLRLGDRYLAWIVPAEGEVRRVDLGGVDEIEDAARAFAELSAVEGNGWDADAWHKAGCVLRELIWAPIQTHLGEGIHTVYLCPDAALAAVPFAALPSRRAGRFFLDVYQLRTVSMAQDLVPRKVDPAPGVGAVALGAVNYGSASVTGERETETSSGSLAAVDRAPRGPRFESLPQTDDEVAFVQQRLGETCKVLRGENATEARFRAVVRGRRLVHLATHGFVRTDLRRGLGKQGDDTHWLGAARERQLAAGYDPMLLAGLAFAGANPRDGAHGDDGILTAAEVSYLDLDGVDLVVLSACETALGRAASGEGVIGLVRRFQMAGAKRVIASLWQVDDEATRLLMQHLYNAMLREEDPLPPAEALREAALAVRGATGAGGRSFAAPRYWAAFVAYGR